MALEIGTAYSSPAGQRHGRGLFVFVLVLAVAAIGFGIWLYLSQQRSEARQVAQDSLATIADLKAHEIATWMKERRADGQVARLSPVIPLILADPENPAVRAKGIERLEVFRNAYDYAAVMVSNSQGKIVLAVPADAPLKYTNSGEIQSVLKGGAVQVSDLHQARPNELIQMCVSCPIGGTPSGSPDGVVVLVIDPNRFLFSNIRNWPLPSRTAEALLLRRDGDDIVFLSGQRHGETAPLAAGLPIYSANGTAEAQAVLGTEGTMEGLDYRGNSVFAALRKIKDTPWSLVAKIDQEEVFSPLTKDLYSAALIGLLLLTVTVMGFRLLWRQQTLEFARRELAERKQAEDALRASEERFRVLIENASDIITVVDKSGVLRFVSPSIKRILGYEPEELLDQNAFDWIHKDDAQTVSATLQSLLADSSATASVEYRFKHRDGTWRTLNSIGRNIANQSPDGFVVVNSRDITESLLLSAQLRQAQKMEAIGHLAGGVAHDFNNLLTVINGRSQMLIEKLKAGDPIRQKLELIYSTGERAANLTRQLLAFSRRQILQPKVINLNQIVTEIEKMLRRLIREDIEMSTKLDPALRTASADPGQIEQVLLNLVVNARDAMPSGGKLYIESSNIEFDDAVKAQNSVIPAGSYVMLTVSDTGCGMDDNVKAHLFEPFFTTKEQGKGTGLGLATVFGIVQQSNGHIVVYSELGKGTTFQVYLPQQGGKEDARPTMQIAIRAGRGESILVVEDQEQVRALAREVLEENGYTVLEGSNGSEGLAIFQEQGKKIHMVLTDAVMPKMSGLELTQNLRRISPEVKVLLMSGYTDHRLAEESAATPGIHFMQKPFTAGALLRKVNEVLQQK